MTIVEGCRANPLRKQDHCRPKWMVCFLLLQGLLLHILMTCKELEVFRLKNQIWPPWTFTVFKALILFLIFSRLCGKLSGTDDAKKNHVVCKKEMCNCQSPHQNLLLILSKFKEKPQALLKGHGRRFLSGLLYVSSTDLGEQTHRVPPAGPQG